MSYENPLLPDAPSPGALPPVSAPTSSAAPAAAPAAAASTQITIDDFMKVELRTAKVLTAERVEKSRKLLKLSVDVGTEVRTLVAGIAEAQHELDALARKTVVIVFNLEAGEADGNRVGERHGPRGQSRRRQTDGRVVRRTAGAGQCEFVDVSRTPMMECLAFRRIARSGWCRTLRPKTVDPSRRACSRGLLLDRRRTGTALRETATARYFESIRKQPSQLLLFLRDMPAKW